MTSKPSDIQLPSILATEEAKEAYCERLTILAEHDNKPYTDAMKIIAIQEALEVDRKEKGLLKL